MPASRSKPNTSESAMTSRPSTPTISRPSTAKAPAACTVTMRFFTVSVPTVIAGTSATRVGRDTSASSNNRGPRRWKRSRSSASRSSIELTEASGSIRNRYGPLSPMVTGVTRTLPSSGPTSGNVHASPLENPGGGPEAQPATRQEIESASSGRARVVMASRADGARTTVVRATARDRDDFPTGAHRPGPPAIPRHRHAAATGLDPVTCGARWKPQHGGFPWSGLVSQLASRSSLSPQVPLDAVHPRPRITAASIRW